MFVIHREVERVMLSALLRDLVRQGTQTIVLARGRG